jgi:hypothetical protein
MSFGRYTCLCKKGKEKKKYELENDPSQEFLVSRLDIEINLKYVHSNGSPGALRRNAITYQCYKPKAQDRA